ncbi:glycosyltransferase family 4 protein [Paenibacillus yonginensis]|uniref:glycosyltransferase family 4 protein n=1 Tax=Paenibacillus yonginensis TaxID=1462996 RepID=UPI0012489DC8|nr:glycosyltransferase family 4 protein [Paenibacillus yonginensis]
MRIAYLIHWNEGAESGVLKKVMHQVTEWRQQGHQPALFLFTCRPNEDWSRACAEAGIELTVQVYKGYSGRMADFGLLAKKVRRWQPEVLYHRFDLYYLALPGLLRAVPSVLEINTNDMAELRMEQGFRYYYHSFTRGKVLSAADGHVYVSRELSESEHYRPFAKPSMVIGNGIQLEAAGDGPVAGERDNKEAAEQEEDAVSPRAPRLVFMGSAGQSWHGLDHIAELASLKPDWRFDLIGVEAGELEGLRIYGADDSQSSAGLGSKSQDFVKAGERPKVRVASRTGSTSGVAETGAGATEESSQRPSALAGEPASGDPAKGKGAGTELPQNLFFHGKMTRSAYQPLLDQADIAVGTLALYRKHMTEASPLKVREYLANGLPVIMAYEDTDFPAEVPFLLKLPAEPDLIRRHLGKIEQFVEAWKGRRIGREQVSHLDTRFKEAVRLRFMEHIAALRTGGNGSGP